MALTTLPCATALACDLHAVKEMLQYYYTGMKNFSMYTNDIHMQQLK
jgi:hypothetical protein